MLTILYFPIFFIYIKDQYRGGYQPSCKG